MAENLEPDFTREELAEFLAGLGNPSQPLEGYKTAREWAHYLGISECQMHIQLRMASERGWLLVRKDRRRRIDGTPSVVPVYAFDLGAVKA